jgi:hypothetical protein
MTDIIKIMKEQEKKLNKKLDSIMLEEDSKNWTELDDKKKVKYMVRFYNSVTELWETKKHNVILAYQLGLIDQYLSN